MIYPIFKVESKFDMDISIQVFWTGDVRFASIFIVEPLILYGGGVRRAMILSTYKIELKFDMDFDV